MSYDGTTIISNGKVQGASTPQLGRFGKRTRVGHSSGIGKVAVLCRTAPGDHCRFKLTQKSGATTVGRIKGVVRGNVASRLTIRLTSAGRSLLKQHKVLGVHVAGSVKEDNGITAPVSGHLTLVR